MNKIEDFRKIVDEINKEYSNLQNLSDDELRLKTHSIAQNINKCKNKVKILDEYLILVFAIVKETARRFTERNLIVEVTDYDIILSKDFDFVTIQGGKAIYKNRWDVGGVAMQWSMVHYDEQLLGGILIHRGYAVEMATGEGKTLVATLPAFLNALSHEGVHLMTVNDYLSKRDFEITHPLYAFHGLSADCLEYYERDYRRKKAYKADITFGTNSTFTFDYLYDHLAVNPDMCVQQKHNFAIIDELDSILIDDADEPHMVGSGKTYNCGKIYKDTFSVVKEMVDSNNDKLFKVDLLTKSVCLTNDGKKWLEQKLNKKGLYLVERAYEIANFEELSNEEKQSVLSKLELQNVIIQILLALTVYECDIDYIIENEKVKIIDQHTGRVKENNRWEFGLHTAIEVKEGVKVQDDFDGIAVISLKNYFRLYNKIAGMSGTIMPIEDELQNIYKLKCAVLPTHKPMIRKDEPLRIFRTTAWKDEAIIKTIIENKNNGRPTLVGSISVKRSEIIGNLLNNANIVFNKLDAKTTKDEAVLVSKAGIGNTITVSTSVAGRGTDIKPSDDAIKNGGLLVIGTDLFESIRVDRQLKGRSGRQGNPGSSVFFASLDDFILKNLSKEDVASLLSLAFTIEGNEISTEEVRRYFFKAQANREEYFRKKRAETARKDDIVAPRRKKFYDSRNAVLFDPLQSETIITDVLSFTNTPAKVVEDNLNNLYIIIKELINRSIRNNNVREYIWIPFSDHLFTFAVQLDIKKTLANSSYFYLEFKRQNILQVYDKCWKDYVQYMMGNLDKKEIDALDIKYDKMMKEIQTIILSRLCESTIPFNGIKIDPTENYLNEDVEEFNSVNKAENITKNIQLDQLCPCGSGKLYCDCHGNNNRSIRIRKKRRR